MSDGHVASGIAPGETFGLRYCVGFWILRVDPLLRPVDPAVLFAESPGYSAGRQSHTVSRLECLGEGARERSLSARDFEMSH